jgi:hypothetical protein
MVVLQRRKFADDDKLAAKRNSFIENSKSNLKTSTLTSRIGLILSVFILTISVIFLGSSSNSQILHLSSLFHRHDYYIVKNAIIYTMNGLEVFSQEQSGSETVADSFVVRSGVLISAFSKMNTYL